MKYVCNPVNFPYQYQFNQSGITEGICLKVQ